MLKGTNMKSLFESYRMDVYAWEVAPELPTPFFEGKVCCKSLQNQNDLYKCYIIPFPLSRIKLPHSLQQSIVLSMKIDKAMGNHFQATPTDIF